MIGDGIQYRRQIALRLVAEVGVVLVRHRVEQRRDTAALVVEAKISRGDHRAVAVAFEQVGEDADEVARLLRLGGDENLILEKLHEMGSEGPALDELPPNLIVLRRWGLRQSQVLGDVDVDRCLDLRVRNLHAVLEQTVEQQSLPVLIGWSAP